MLTLRKNSKTWNIGHTVPFNLNDEEEGSIRRQGSFLQWRFLSLYLFLCAVFILMVGSLIRLQLVEGSQNLFLSTQVKTHESVVRAPRGIIYDRNLTPLVVNKPSFRLVIETSEIPEGQADAIFERLAELLGENPEDISYVYNKSLSEEGDGDTRDKRVILKNDLNQDQLIAVYARSDQLPGIFVETDSKREYRYGENMTHILGFIGEVTEEDIERDKDKYSSGDVIGKTGIELVYDDDLRGRNGRRVVEHDIAASEIKELLPMEAKPGDSLILSLDVQAQDKLAEALRRGIERSGASGGAAIIEDLRTGEIIAGVSLPSYDNNLFVGGISLKEYEDLRSNPNDPLYNRMIQSAQPPGSTIKTVTGAAALQEGKITKDTIIDCPGCIDLGGGREFCDAQKRKWGEIELMKAYEVSSSIYFCTAGQWTGIDVLDDYMEGFGLGSKTGIDLAGESGGILPSREILKKRENREWTATDTCFSSVGQGIHGVTPIQMANWMAAIGNGGEILTPHVMREVVDREGNVVEKKSKMIVRSLPVEEQNLEIVREGMYRVVNGEWGSGYLLRGLKADPAAKTGTAETVRKVDGVFESSMHAWVGGFFPYNDPQYSFVVFLEYGGYSSNAAEVMREFLPWYWEEYLGNG